MEPAVRSYFVNASRAPAIIVMGIFLQLAGSQTVASDNILPPIKNASGTISISIIFTGSGDASISEDPSTSAQTLVPWVTRYGGSNAFHLEEASITDRSMTSTTSRIFTPPVTHSTDASIATSEASRKNEGLPTFVSDVTTVGSIAQNFTGIPTKENIQQEAITISFDSKANAMVTMPMDSTIDIATETTVVMTPRSNDKMFTSMTTESAPKSSMNKTFSDVRSTGTIFLEIVNGSTTLTQSSTGSKTSISEAPDKISTFMATIAASETNSGRETINSSGSKAHTEPFGASGFVAVSSKNTVQPSLSANSPTTISSLSAASETLTSLDFSKGIEASISEASITEATVPTPNITSKESSLLKILFPVSDINTTKATSAGSTSPTLASTPNYEDTVPLDSNSGGDVSTPTISGNDDETSLPFADITAFGSIRPEVESSKRKRPMTTAVGSTVEIPSILTNVTRAEESLEERSSFVTPGNSPEPTSSAGSNAGPDASAPVSSVRVTNISNSSSKIAVTETSTSMLLNTNTEIFLVSKTDARTQISIGPKISSSLPSRNDPEISISTDSTFQTSILSRATYTTMGTISLAPKVAITSKTHTTDSNATLSREILEAATGTNVTLQVTIPKAMPAPTIMTSTMTSGSAGLPLWAIISICLTAGLALLLLLSLPFLILGLPFPRLVQPRTYVPRHLIWESDLGIELESGVENHGRSMM